MVCDENKLINIIIFGINIFRKSIDKKCKKNYNKEKNIKNFRNSKFIK